MPVAVVLMTVAGVFTAVDWLLLGVLWLPCLPLTPAARLATAGMLVVVAAETVLQQFVATAGPGRLMSTAHPAAALAGAVLQLAVTVLFGAFVVTLGRQFRAAFTRRDGGDRPGTGDPDRP